MKVEIYIHEGQLENLKRILTSPVHLMDDEDHCIEYELRNDGLVPLICVSIEYDTYVTLIDNDLLIKQTDNEY